VQYASQHELGDHVVEDTGEISPPAAVQFKTCDCHSAIIVVLGIKLSGRWTNSDVRE
jgi:hypothetical protein